jgi:hypothetical protein
MGSYGPSRPGGSDDILFGSPPMDRKVQGKGMVAACSRSREDIRRRGGARAVIVFGRPGA